MPNLRELLRGVLTEEELKLLPSGYERLGHVLVVNLPPALKPKFSRIGERLLELKGVRTVVARKGIVGRYRRPVVELVAGERVTETLHREHGCKFKLDVSKVMFSAGNLYERRRVAELVKPGEVVVDLFAGVGQFTIPIAKLAQPKLVYAVELNPVAYEYLLENVRLNGVGDRVRPLLGDCAKVAPRGVADRVVMGILHVGHRYLPLALEVLRPEGGVIHYHESVPSKLRWERPLRRIRAAAGEREVKILNRRVVKRYAPGVDHVVVDVEIRPGGRELA